MNHTQIKYTVESFEKKILGHLDDTCQAFDLEEIMCLAPNDAQRMLCWNAAMNLVESGKVNLLQIQNTQNQQVRWIILGFINSEFKYDWMWKKLSNKKWVPPGVIKTGVDYEGKV
jgi:hypothetical protein